MALPELLTAEQVAEHLGVAYGTVLRAIKSGDLRARKIGKGYRITEAAVTEYISGDQPATAPTGRPPRASGRVTRGAA